MVSSTTALTLALLPVAALAQETVFAAYMFHRHGDRTDKQHTPANLTDLGYNQVVNSGNYYRNRYVASDATNKIVGLNSDIVKLSQIQASAPVDNVLQSSALGFLQGLYPPVGAESAQTLRNGTTIDAPMNGYQLIPLAVQSTGTASEDSSWLQSASSCNNAEISSNEYFYTPEYTTLLNNTAAFYESVFPVINNTFSSAQDTFKNAYIIYDLINVAEIHNITFDPTNIITNETFLQLQNLANVHEFNLAWNESSPIRGVQGMVLAGQILSFFNNSINAKGSSSSAKFGAQFGAYAEFTSFFGLTNLTEADEMFYGIPGYASVMTFELFTNATYNGSFPSTQDLQVRMLWHNGSTAMNPAEDLTPQSYPLFGQSSDSLYWNDFYNRMMNISLLTSADWCTACGNTTGTCAGVTAAQASSPAATSAAGNVEHSSGGGLSNGVSGVIGAMVTLGVILGAEALLLLFGGLRLTKKNKGWQPNMNGGRDVPLEPMGAEEEEPMKVNVGPSKRH